jgi:folate-binding protein YgfZ
MPVAHLSSRSVLEVSGADSRAFLQGMVTNDVLALRPGACLWTGLLSPQGKTLFAFFAHDVGGRLFLDCDGGQAEALRKRLLMFRLRKDVAVEPSDLRVFAGWGEGVPAGVSVDPRVPGAGWRWLAEAAETDAKEGDYRAHEWGLGLPDAEAIGQDQLLWLEVNGRELNGVSFTKGCYVGQENTSRMHYRDKVRKRLLPVRFSGDAGDGRILSGEREAGILRPGGRFALMRMELVGDGLSLGGEPVEVLVPGWLEAATVSAER